ncbi:unnamed protein product [Allacma fusca]|uniref:Uncharacterized protein n=1 Tax=Allacma fusca TaxID=39272 RepID=A0A8J2PB46_9HEXA|nr:unnamed protein product [Allacma fusca]
MGDEFKGSILYELICCSQWVDEREDHVPLKSLPDKCSSVISQMNPASFLRSKPSVHENISWITSLGPTWNFAATPDGKIIAILQATSLETRSDRDHFNSHIGRSSIPKDVYPNFRRMEWNQDGSLLAVSYTNGQVSFFDLMATQLFVVRLFPLPTVDDFSACFSVDHALSGLFFVEERVKKATFPNELIVVDRRGGIKSFRQTSADGMDLNHEYSFRRFYPEGTTAVTYCAKNSIILVCGTLDVGNDMMKRKEQNLSHGVTVWRLLNDHPYYRIVFNVPQQEFRMDSRSLWRLAFSVISRRSNASEDTIFKVSISPNSKLLATISTSGTISIWHLPSLKLHQQWPLKSQFQHNAENPSFNCHWRVALNRSRDKAVDPWRFHPFDINWWNNEVVIISRVNGCVSLCSVEDHVPSKNLLGDSPEHFESPVFVSTRFNKELVASDFWLKTIYQEIMFLMTDSEQFRPPRKRKRKPPTWIDTHRLFNVRSITPLELFHRKIDAEEYGEALDLAKIYNLDSDLVFQRRWTKTPVTVRSIKDFLAKITKRNWVLQECLDRVPDNLIAARKLLEFGMKGTDLTAAVTISQGRDKGRFIIWAPDDLDISQDEYLSLIDKDNIEVQRLIGYRKQFLHFLDMLNTYEMILGGALLSEENFDSNVYSKLRNNSVLESCIEMARNSDVSGLKIMCINHWVDVSPYYLHILSSFPETTPAHNYRDFLPEVTSDGQVLLWDEIMPKEKDWSDSFPVLSAFDGSRVLPDPETHTVEYICHWYECRVRQIESLTGLTNLSLDLSRLGVERNITKLQNLLENLETVETLVYDIRITDMSLEKLERLSNIEKVELLMSTAKEDSYIENFRLFALPFLNYCERREPGSKFTLLNQYLTKLSQDDLKLTLKIFEQSKREATDPIIADVCDLMKLAYNCIYACKSSKQNDNILALLGCLPDRGYGGYVIKDSELEKLHDAIDQLELHYHAVQILEKYSLPYSLKEIQTMADDEDEISVFFEKLCSGANKKNPPMKVNEWKTLLYDILELHKKIFVKYEVEKCYMFKEMSSSKEAEGVVESSKLKIKVLIGATGSVAAIKIPELLSKILAKQHSKVEVTEVAVVPTEKALHFFNQEDVTPEKLNITGKTIKIWRDADEWTQWNGRGDPVVHIDLGKWADVMILAPLDANTLAKISAGMCDNLLTCILRAWDLKDENKKVIFCPAMNTKMWEHPLTAKQVESLVQFGYHYVKPISKTLMCGDTGIGAMAHVDDIVETFFSLAESFSDKITSIKTYVSALLRSGYSDIINLARNFLDQTPTEVETDERGELKITRTNSTAYSTSYALYLYLIPYEESLGMVLEAAELYFDSASNYSDPDMELSKVCLNLMQNSKEPSITYMFDLIDAVKVLNKDFNLHILPQSVRRSQEKMGLLKKSMENIKDGYKKTQQLLKLALFLRIDDMDQEEVESCVFEMAGNAGIAESDIKFCTQICHGIMAKGYHAGWKVFTQVAKFQSDPPVLDHDTRLAFINYALNICPNDEIFEVLNAKYLIEIRSLQAKLSELSPSDSAVETAILESQEQESIMHDILNKMKFEEFVHTTTTWINPLKKVAQVVKTGGGAILAGTGRTIQENIISSNPVQPCQEELSNENFLQESYPAFYVTTDDVHLVHTSLLAYKYNSFSSASVSNYVKSNPALELCLTINRIWHLERLLLGTSEAGDRDFKVLEQLVSEILPEDVPWGLAILSSIDDVTVLSKVLQSVPQTQTSYRIILAYLSYRINKELNIEMKDGDLAAGNLNKLISDTANLVGGEDFLETHPDQRLRDLISIFYQYQDYLIDPFAPEVNGGQDIVKGEKSEPDSDDEDYQQGDGWED